MSGNRWWSAKVGAKLLSYLVICSIISSDIPLDIHESIWVASLKYFRYLLAGINTNWFWSIPEEKYFAPLRILNLLIKSFVNRFVDIALIFFDSSFNSFIFEITFLFNFFSLSSKSVFSKKLVKSFLLANFSCANCSVNFSDINLLNSWVVIYLSWSWSAVILFSISIIFVL